MWRLKTDWHSKSCASQLLGVPGMLLIYIYCIYTCTPPCKGKSILTQVIQAQRSFGMVKRHFDPCGSCEWMWMVVDPSAWSISFWSPSCATSVQLLEKTRGLISSIEDLEQARHQDIAKSLICLTIYVWFIVEDQVICWAFNIESGVTSEPQTHCFRQPFESKAEKGLNFAPLDHPRDPSVCFLGLCGGLCWPLPELVDVLSVPVPSSGIRANWATLRRRVLSCSWHRGRWIGRGAADLARDGCPRTVQVVSWRHTLERETWSEWNLPGLELEISIYIYIYIKSRCKIRTQVDKWRYKFNGTQAAVLISPTNCCSSSSFNSKLIDYIYIVKPRTENKHSLREIQDRPVTELPSLEVAMLPIMWCYRSLDRSQTLKIAKAWLHIGITYLY